MITLPRIVCFAGLLLFLSACSTASKDEEGNVDYFLIKADAEKAYKEKDYKTAEKEYLKITEGVPLDPDAWFKLGNISARTQRPNRAVLYYKEALVRNARLSKAWNNLAVVYLRQSLNAYTSLVKHAESGDPLIEAARERLEKLYEFMGKDKAADAVDDPTRPPEQ